MLLPSLTLVGAFLAVVPHQGSAEVWPLFPDGAVPGEHGGSVGPEVHRQTRDGTMVYNVSAPLMESFLVDRDSPLNIGSAVVVAPGGGYELLAWSKEGVDIATWLNSIGISAFVLKYRVPGRSWLKFGEAELMDAQRAMGLVRQRAAALGLNTSRVGILGFSAGGNLVGQLATHFAQRVYPHVDAADDWSCRPDFALMVYPWKLLHKDLRTPALPVTSLHPPSFFTHAEDDPTAPVETSIFYYAALKAAGAPASELNVYPSGGHGFGRCTTPAGLPPSAEVCSWPARAAAFLRALGVAADPPASSPAAALLV